ncbi:hypothetical protein ACIPZ8_14605 [Pseudomonas sp. NPDC089422]|uniref:PA0061/PA0062 family lipoprotein n=1 Tax=Pseudomonas sp. NPDC089422 TaxID=3364466 RepID=UPI00380CD3AB
MSTKWKVMLPLLGVLGVLSGCAGPMPKASSDAAWVSLKEEPTTTLMAESLDGKRLNDGRYFEVPTGKHTLGAALFVEGDGDSNGSTCNANISYNDFKPGRRYTLDESSLGHSYTLNLYNENEKLLAHVDNINCPLG